VPHFLHPVKVAVLEAFMWMDQPLSPKELDLLFDQGDGVSLVAYHVRSLADACILEKARQKTVRGAVQTFYRLSRNAAVN
jgi:hypothetical protein